MASEEDQKACMKDIAEWATEKTDSFPKALKDLLIKLGFPRVVVTERNPPQLLQPYEARLHDKIQVQPQSAATEAVVKQYPHAERFAAHVVPMVRHGADGQAIKTFPAGHFVAVDLKAPADGARVVATSQLTGCSFVIGFDKKNKHRCLLGHAQPAKSQPPPPAPADKKGEASSAQKAAPSNRALLAKHFKDADAKSVFEGEEVKDIYVMGGDAKGYGDDTADVLGWISGGKFFLAVWTRNAKKLSIHQYPPGFLDRLKP